MLNKKKQIKGFFRTLMKEFKYIVSEVMQNQNIQKLGMVSRIGENFETTVKF